MMKKTFYAFLTAALLSTTTVFASGDSFSISQIELIDYIIYAGIALFVIGMICILVSLKTPRTDYLPEDFDEIDSFYANIEDEYQNENDDIELDADEDIIDEDDLPEEAPAAEADDTPEEDEADTAVEEADAPVEEAEPLDEEPEEVIEEAEEEAEEVIEETIKPVRLTLSGLNNPDLKIIDIEDSITIGRRSTNDLIISDNAVSGEHCKFTYDGEAVCIEDLNSTNGTILNGEAVENAKISSGDTLIIGKNQYKITLS